MVRVLFELRADVNLKDNPEESTYDFPNGEDASSVEVHVIETFQSVKGNQMALAEIEFFETSIPRWVKPRWARLDTAGSFRMLAPSAAWWMIHEDAVAEPAVPC